jgi:hypothetical protein
MKRRRVLSVALMILSLLPGMPMRVAHADADPISGAIFTTVLPCADAVNRNIYDFRTDVYLNGGPDRPGAAGLPPGAYYVRVTEPSATNPTGGVLGTSIGGASGSTPVVVGPDGSFTQCYQLSSILIKISDSSQGYDLTGNPGGEYKVWVCQDAAFTESLCKTDNFMVKETAGVVPGWLQVIKFYDTNANGLNDDGVYNYIEGWKVRIVDGGLIDLLTRMTPIPIAVDRSVLYTVSESTPNESNWVATTPKVFSNVQVTSTDQNNPTTVAFGNLCLGEGGGLTLGFWSNKNGQSLITSSDLANLSALSLRNSDGSNFDPGTKTLLRSFLLGADAVNMANMLSAQLAAMTLNTAKNRVSGASLVYAPALLGFAAPSGVTSLGFISINNLMAAANTELGAHNQTPSGNQYRAYQEALKNALDDGNNNQNFVQAKPCEFTFAP